MAVAPTRMFIKEEVLSTKPEIADSDGENQQANKSQSRSCGLAATVATTCSVTKHAFPTVLSRLDALPRGVCSCLLLEQVAEETVSTHF